MSAVAETRLRAITLGGRGLCATLEAGDTTPTLTILAAAASAHETHFVPAQSVEVVTSSNLIKLRDLLLEEFPVLPAAAEPHSGWRTELKDRTGSLVVRDHTDRHIATVHAADVAPQVTATPLALDALIKSERYWAAREAALGPLDETTQAVRDAGLAALRAAGVQA